MKNKENPLVFIILVNWNGYSDTSDCITSLLKIHYQNYKIVMVDNGSVENEATKLKENFPGLITFRSNENLGFSGGNNLGIEYAMKENADFILLLNNDTTVEHDFLDKLLSKTGTTDHVGIIAPRINYYSEPQKIWSEGGYISKIRGSGFADSEKMESTIDNKDKIVNFVSGCCMLIDNEVFRKTGMFDENYFLYVEDTDFCWRVQESGFKIIVVADSKIYHKVQSSTTRELSTLPLYYVTRNRLYFAKKNFNNVYLITFFYLFFTFFFKSIGWFISGKFEKIKIIKKSFADFINGSMGKKEFN